MNEHRSEKFWQTKSLAQMNHSEWEALCDGCAQCCLIKLENEDNGDLYVTNIACKLLDIETCRCKHYQQRLEKVATCIKVSADDEEIFKQLPQTCAYRCLHEGRPLPEWHPLLTNQTDSMREQGITVQAYAVSEQYIHPLEYEDHIIEKLE